MVSFLQIPGFGVFNKPLPDALADIAGMGVNLIKARLAPETSVETTQASVTEISPPPYEQTEDPVLPHDSNANLITHLTSPHSQLLAMALQADVPSSDISNENLSKIEEKVPEMKHAEHKVEDQKVEEKKEAASTSHSSKNDKSKRIKTAHHHHRHHHLRSHKK